MRLKRRRWEIANKSKKHMNKAVFLDRDGVINEMIYYPEHGIVDSPFTPEQFKLFPWAGRSIKKLSKAGYKVIVVSNQPGIAKGYLSQAGFDRIREKMLSEFKAQDAFIDGEYYCFHHPEAKVKRLKSNCKCRKPEPGLLLKAAEELDINLSLSWMIGDGLTDIQAGEKAGCKTILLGRMKCDLCSLMDELNARPDFVAKNLLEAVKLVVR
jgi:D-glycero-D-manno-heptose 1,7-bisphosphate phosphatase